MRFNFKIWVLNLLKHFSFAIIFLLTQKLFNFFSSSLNLLYNYQRLVQVLPHDNSNTLSSISSMHHETVTHFADGGAEIYDNNKQFVHFAFECFSGRIKREKEQKEKKRKLSFHFYWFSNELWGWVYEELLRKLIWDFFVQIFLFLY